MSRRTGYANARFRERRAENTVFRVRMHDDVARGSSVVEICGGGLCGETTGAEETLSEPEGRVQRDPRLRRTCGGRPCGCLLLDDVDVYQAARSNCMTSREFSAKCLCIRTLLQAECQGLDLSRKSQESERTFG